MTIRVGLSSHPRRDDWISRLPCENGIERHVAKVLILEVPTAMCRNIKTLFNFDPPVTDEEVRAASLQFVRKITGFNKPSKANEAAFLAAIDEIAGVSAPLSQALHANAPPQNPAQETATAQD